MSILDRILALPNFEGEAGGAAAAAATSEKVPAGTPPPQSQPNPTSSTPPPAAETAVKPGETGTATTGQQSEQAPPQAKPDLGLTADMKALLLEGLDGDAKTRMEKWLATRSSVRDIAKSAYSADSKIQEIMQGRVKIPTGKDDDPKDVAAYRKAMGIPDAPEKYAIPIENPTDTDKEMWGEALKDFHAAGLGQKQVDAIGKAWARTQAMAEKAMTDRAKMAAEKAQEDLRVEYGRDYKPNLALANRWLGEQLKNFGDEGKAILDKRFADGTALGEHPDFVKFIVGLAKADSDAGAFVQGESTEGVSIDKRLAEIEAMQIKDPKRYGSPAIQDELMKLTAIQIKRSGGGGRPATEHGR